jgi:hypothetical protein
MGASVITILSQYTRPCHLKPTVSTAATDHRLLHDFENVDYR